jgi:hypothetical protein
VVRKYAKAQIEAVHRLKKDRGTTLKILAECFVGVKDAEAFEKGYDRVVPHAKIVPPKQYRPSKESNQFLERWQRTSPG